MSQDPSVGKVIDGRYEILARIGEGGMGVVYKARQTSIDRVIAIKMLNAQMAADPTWVQRFYNEAKACSRLQHPNTIRMFDFGQSQDGRLFMSMEFLDGVSLRDALAKGPIAAQRVVKILIQCCASLAEAHSIGIIHRDIKPDNVFLLNMAGSPDFVKLLDFSVAKLLEGDRMKTQAGVVFGTPQYMSPEQGRGLPLDARSDLYALGILAFEMLTGNVPFNDDNPMTVIQMHLHGGVPPLPQSVPPSVQSLVRRAMEKEPSRRFQSAGEMMQTCQQVFAELSQGAMIVPGMPKTMIAPPPGPPMGGGMQPPMGGMQQPPMNMQPPMGGMQQPPMGGPPNMGGMQQPPPSAAQAKTIVAMQSPFAQGGPSGMPPNGMQPNGMQPNGYPQPNGMQPNGMQPNGMPNGFQPAAPSQKTIVGGMMPQISGGQMMPPTGMPPNGMPPNGMPAGYPPPQGGPAASGPNKTVMLQPSEGIVSQVTSGPVQPAGVTGANFAAGPQGATTLFWIVSLVIGVAVGALAYVIVLQV